MHLRAVYALRDVLRNNPEEAKPALAMVGLHILLRVLREQEDTDMMIGALEVLISAVGGIGGANGSNDTSTMAGTSDDAAAPGEDDVSRAERMSGEMLTQDGKNIELLLHLVMSDEFYVKYSALQLLTALSNGYSGFRLREQLLSSTNSVNLIIDMLSDREVVRNEALILLVGLANADG